MFPVISMLLFNLGGWGKYNCLFIMPAKWWRWLFIGLFAAAIYWNAWLILTYYIATNVPYGESSWIRKLIGRNLCWYLYGFLFGLASFPVLGWLAIPQAIMGGVIFHGLMVWSNDGYQKQGYPIHYLDHKWVERGIGLCGTILYWFV